MFYSEVMAKNVANKIRQLLHASKGALLCFLTTHQEIFSMNDQTWNNFEVSQVNIVNVLT